MTKGIVYILTNPCLDGWIKIGMTEKNGIADRLRSLNSSTSIPLSFRCYATYEVEKAYDVEQRIHSIIDRVDGSLHAREMLHSGKIREREFFRISPEVAYGIFQDIAFLRGDELSLKLHSLTQNDVIEEEISEEISEKISKRRNNSFANLGIERGEQLTFLTNEKISVIVEDDKNIVKYNNELLSILAMAKKLLVELNGWNANTQVNGWRYFLKNGRVLSELRAEQECEIE